MTFDVTCYAYLLVPNVDFRQTTPTTARVAVPETSVHEDNLPTCAKHNVWFTWQVFAVHIDNDSPYDAGAAAPPFRA